MNPKLYHWILLVVCVLFAFVEGVLDVVGGASSGAIHNIDDIAVRFIGAGLVVFGLLVFTRKSWAFWGLIGFFTFSIIEIELTCHMRTHGINRLIEILIVRGMLFAFFGMPMVLLIWLWYVFVVPNNSPEPTATAPTASPTNEI